MPFEDINWMGLSFLLYLWMSFISLGEIRQGLFMPSATYKYTLFVFDLGKPRYFLVNEFAYQVG